MLLEGAHHRGLLRLLVGGEKFKIVLRVAGSAGKAMDQRTHPGCRTVDRGRRRVRLREKWIELSALIELLRFDHLARQRIGIENLDFGLNRVG